MRILRLYEDCYRLKSRKPTIQEFKAYLLLTGNNEMSYEMMSLILLVGKDVIKWDEKTQKFEMKI
jgi:hypothetical protein